MWEAHSSGLSRVLAPGMRTRVHVCAFGVLRAPPTINLSTELRGCLVQIGHLIVSAQQAQMDVKTSVFPKANLVTQLVDRVKYGLGLRCHAWPT